MPPECSGGFYGVLGFFLRGFRGQLGRFCLEAPKWNLKTKNLTKTRFQNVPKPPQKKCLLAWSGFFGGLGPWVTFLSKGYYIEAPFIIGRLGFGVVFWQKTNRVLCYEVSILAKNYYVLGVFCGGLAINS